MLAKILIAALFSLTSNGCLFRENIEGLLVLKTLGENQKSIEQSLKAQERLFGKLIAHIKKDKLKPGVPLENFIRSYGEPIVSKDIPQGKRLLYRHPADYFDSDKVYAYFGQEGKLINWEYMPR